MNNQSNEEYSAEFAAMILNEQQNANWIEIDIDEHLAMLDQMILEAEAEANSQGESKMKAIRYKVDFSCEVGMDVMALPCIQKLINEEYEWAYDIWYSPDSSHFIEFHSLLTSDEVKAKFDSILTDGVTLNELWRGEYADAGYFSTNHPEGIYSGGGTIMDAEDGDPPAWITEHLKGRQEQSRK